MILNLNGVHKGAKNEKKQSKIYWSFPATILVLDLCLSAFRSHNSLCGLCGVPNAHLGCVHSGGAVLTGSVVTGC